MKIYDDRPAPNPRRVRIFLAEKGIAVPFERVSIMKMEHKTPEFRRMSPLERLPVLELDDGTFLTETVAICRYFEELHPNPALMGIDARDKAIVEMWQRRVELDLFVPLGHCYRHTSPQMANLEDQVPEWGELNRGRAAQRLAWFDSVLADRPYIAGDRYTIADITALCAVDFAKWSKITIQPEQTNLQRWHAEVSGRPSAQA